ncbi:hypothetical protein CAPTEDRAFT_101464 [Capitella teleta]|uniref:tRNA (guanine(9)-N(1))-methyltransferase n=1 Tax=Capitella teleta TaxID=283909 RepID=R7TZD9_CAPTE|nr:hypothetical protein CAPTEDRAFT_101464 [Capitella teleta]|eukprot:ELT96766.1 hypothetical protein CAPTEDRAFT_101464 [Capitella teleta]
MSKHQLKRLKRFEEKMRKRPEMRAKERQKKKERIKAMREQGIELGPSRKKLKKNCMVDSACKTQVVIDCSFDHLMQDKQVMCLVQQLQFCYAANRRAANPLQFYVTSCDDKTLTRLDQAGNYRNWDIHYKTEPYHEVFPKENIVYLSSESDNVLEAFEDDKAYIIGGLVDFNHHKGLCHKLAVERGLQHARLPIDEYAFLKTRKVLTINHVFEILLHFSETKSWKEAFLSVIPSRKGLRVLPESATSKNTNSSDTAQNHVTRETDLSEAKTNKSND